MMNMTLIILYLYVQTKYIRENYKENTNKILV